MFNFSDVRGISRLAALLVYPLISAAVYDQFGLLFKLVNDTNNFLYYPFYGISFFIQVLITILIVELLDVFCVGWLTLKTGYFGPVLGFTLLTIGVLPLAYINIAKGNIVISHSLLWHFACLAWGFRMLNASNKIKS